MSDTEVDISESWQRFSASTAQIKFKAAIYSALVDRVERKGYIRGLRAAARKARRESELSVRVSDDCGLPALVRNLHEAKAVGGSRIARWCDRRASKIERGLK